VGNDHNVLVELQEMRVLRFRAFAALGNDRILQDRRATTTPAQLSGKKRTPS